MEKKLRTLISQLVSEEISLMEKKRKKDEAPSEENIELDLSTPSGDTTISEPVVEPAIEPDMNAMSDGGSSAEKRIGQGLQMALDAAKELPDDENKTKLVRQIGNTALFFLKSQIQGDTTQM